LKLTSRLDETAGDFTARVGQALRERRDEEVEKLKAKYATRVQTLTDRIRRAEEKVAREKAQAGQQKLSAALGFGATILGALMGRRVMTAGNVSRAASTMRSAGRIGKEAADVERAGESLEVTKQRLADLEQQFEAEIETLQSQWDPDSATIDTTQVRPRKSDITIVGAIAVAPSDPNVIYVGTGSACPRGNISPGDGVYKSVDAGATWRHIGLPKAGLIGRILVHPADPELVYVAVLGNIFAANPERGVFRSTDGGLSWSKVLFVSDEAGAVDLAMNPVNPRVLYAATWQARRSPWNMVSGGPGSGLYKSVDGGNTWVELEEGLPEGVWADRGGGVAANPQRVWALVEAEDGGLFRSDDGGGKFRLVSADRELRQRAWYYTHIEADPPNADTVYVLNVMFWNRTTAVRASVRSAPRTATATRCGSTPTIPPT
jgi:hypothetical protein